MTKIELISKYDKKPNSVYHLPLFDRWANMNRVCDQNGKAFNRSRCAQKNIWVYEKWRRYRKDVMNYRKINRNNYNNYRKFIEGLIDLCKKEMEGKSKIEFKINKDTRIERIDYMKNYEPYNLKINIRGGEYEFFPKKKDIDELLNKISS